MESSFEKLLVLLADGGVRFVVVGGIAVSLQGYVRLTEDVDLLIDHSPDNVNLLLATLSGYGEGYARELSPVDFTDDEGAIRIVEESEQCQMDIFTRIAGRRYRDVMEDADVFNLQGRSIPHASKASLIGWKSRSGREKDQLDVLALCRLIEDPKAFD
jgi:predicted nucleotidyltransferase